jgi:uncharacterized protein YecT (DUF1311 family)
MTRTLLLISLLAWPCLTSLAAEIPATSAADQFGARRWVSKPSLTVNASPEVCVKIVAVATSLFESTATDLDFAAAIGANFPAVDATPVPGSDTQSTSSLGRADLDLDGTGRQQVIVFRDDTFNWRGDWHYAYVFPNVATFDAASSQVVAEWLSVPQNSQYPSATSPELGAQQYYPSAITTAKEEVQTGDVWADHALFAASGGYYFITGLSAYDRLSFHPTRVFRLRATGQVELACTIEFPRLKPAYDAFQQLPSMASFLRLIREIGAGGDDGGGTMHSGQTHDAQALAAEHRAAFRPWATAPEPAPTGQTYYQYDQRTRIFLEAWSRAELWNRREYQTLLELTGPAEASYASYLQSAFGIDADAARLYAIKVVQALIGSRLEVPSQFSAEQMGLYWPESALHRAVMERDRTAFDRALVHPEPNQQSLRTVQTPGDIIADSALDAVEWPYGLRGLLAAGADPNRSNRFGKTILMVAAHFNRPDAVQQLVQAGANVNAATTPPATGGDGALERTGRTALMYAAENAGPAVIKALLDAGADSAARDSAGHGMDFYLANNPLLTDQERALGVIGLARVADHYAGPSFDCRKATTATETRICSSPVLRMLDAEIARAYQFLAAKSAGVPKDEQRRWLHTRDHNCTGGADADCLAEIMRTHLRYLENRLAEVAPKANGPT